MDANEIASFFDQMPEFTNHEEARSWLKEHFRDNCLFRGSDTRDGRKVYLYHLVKNPEVYHQYMESFASPKPEEHEITNMQTFESYNTLVITEDGDVTVES
ncbi:MAG TPA: hypothetical protein VNM69_08435 [Bacillus sp. (in: firmicutes)]|uniref:hypothetical protein n=1 Tax=Bacillus litorisediminis TaxID=2922713 RepID=UPI001FAEEC2A|nr:hypothetical protein [Bacillus litorisediminis]HWO75906.1 hypothetical protein [Bacillus sp. (in: firmicutes)]